MSWVFGRVRETAGIEESLWAARISPVGSTAMARITTQSICVHLRSSAVNLLLLDSGSSPE
jgi:hypothetical protein